MILLDFFITFLLDYFAMCGAVIFMIFFVGTFVLGA